MQHLAPVAQAAEVVGVALRVVARAEVLVRRLVPAREVRVQPAQAAHKPARAAPRSVMPVLSSRHGFE